MHTTKTLNELDKLEKLADGVSGMGDHTAHRSDFNDLARRIRMVATNIRTLHEKWVDDSPTVIDAAYVEVVSYATHDDKTTEDRDIFAVPTSTEADIEYFFKQLDCVTHEVHVLIADPFNATPHKCVIKIDHGRFVKPFTEEKDFVVKILDCLRHNDSLEKTMDTCPADWKKQDDQ